MEVLIAGFNLEMSLYKFKNIYCACAAGENFKADNRFIKQGRDNEMNHFYCNILNYKYVLI
jgi:hypothetical protein